MRRQQFRRGQVLVLFVVMLPLLLGFVALAVDVVYALMVKAALVTAVDSSVLAGSRAIVNGSAAVADAVDRTFHANLPDGQLVVGQPSYAPNPPVITTESDGSRSISLVGSAQSPTFFLGLFGYRNWNVKAYAKAGRRDVNIMLVLDRSGSLVDAGAWGDVQAGAKFFVQQFDDVHDKVGLVSFGTNSLVDYSPQTSFKTPLVNLINNMQARHGNDTNSPPGTLPGVRRASNPKRRLGAECHRVIHGRAFGCNPRPVRRPHDRLPALPVHTADRRLHDRQQWGPCLRHIHPSADVLSGYLAHSGLLTHRWLYRSELQRIERTSTPHGGIPRYMDSADRSPGLCFAGYDWW
jgi:Flp pilus assembly protein TadG